MRSELALRTLCAFYVVLTFGLPMVGAISLYNFAPYLMVFIPLIYSVLYVLTAGVLSLIHAHGVVEGRHERTSTNPVHFHRTLYNLCWTSVFYFKPIYWLHLSFQPLKHMMFRLFSYKGPMKFTVYPDTWIRDLPLLYLDEGAYVSNRATLGTNIIIDENTVRIGKIHLGKKAMIGHLAVVGLGLKMEANSEIGVRTVTGIEVSLGENADVGAACNIGHFVAVGKNAKVGESAYVATKTKIADGDVISAGYNSWVDKMSTERSN